MRARITTIAEEISEMTGPIDHAVNALKAQLNASEQEAGVYLIQNQFDDADFRDAVRAVVTALQEHSETMERKDWLASIDAALAED
jgi:hypothetical protein